MNYEYNLNFYNLLNSKQLYLMVARLNCAHCKLNNKNFQFI